MIEGPGQTYSIFNGLTFDDFIDKWEQEIARDDPPLIYCGYRILPGFASGIGLRMIVEADVLSQTLIEATLQDFLARGERNGIAEVPSPSCDTGKIIGNRLNAKN